MIDWNKKKCSICSFKLALGSLDGAGKKKIITYLDFVVSKEHIFIRIIVDSEDLENCKEIRTVENYHKSLSYFFKLLSC